MPNKKIIKTHNLIILADENKNLIFLNEDQTRLFELATLYYKELIYKKYSLSSSWKNQNS